MARRARTTPTARSDPPAAGHTHPPAAGRSPRRADRTQGRTRPHSLQADLGTPAAAVRTVGLAGGYGRRRALEQVDLSIEPGELVGVVGPSGSGKTTLLRLLAGRGATRHHGRVEVQGTRPRAARRAGAIAYVPQLDQLDWDFPLTVRHCVLLGRAGQSAALPWFTRTEHRRAEQVLDRLGIGRLADRHIGELSGGQRQRMLLARALVCDAAVVLLDEPTSGVDLATRHDILHLLGELRDEGLTIVLTTHDLNWVAAHLPRVVCLNRTVVADGPPVQVLTPSVLRDTYGADVRVVHDQGMVFVADATHVLDHRPAPPGQPDHPEGDARPEVDLDAAGPPER